MHLDQHLYDPVLDGSDNRFFVLQAVHKLVDFRPGHTWGEDMPKLKFVFIGRNLDRDGIDRSLPASGPSLHILSLIKSRLKRRIFTCLPSLIDMLLPNWQ